MTSFQRGKTTSTVEVTNVTDKGFWLLLEDRQLFVAYKKFPWFLDATVRQITSVQCPTRGHLRWPTLDIDLAVDSIEHPERFPLVSRARPRKVLPRVQAPRRGRR